jgi:hypothetical protein
VREFHGLGELRVQANENVTGHDQPMLTGFEGQAGLIYKQFTEGEKLGFHRRRVHHLPQSLNDLVGNERTKVLNTRKGCSFVPASKFDGAG